MSARYYFLLTSLPALPEMGEPAPLSLAELRAAAVDEPSAIGLVDAVLLASDLMAREAALAGKREEFTPAVLTRGQIAGEEPLPPELQVQPERKPRIAADTTWEAYFRYVLRQGRACGCRFLTAWVGFEAALRNAIVTHRAKTLGLDAVEYFVAPDLADPEANVEDLVAAWSAAGDPLAALRALDEGRWRWVTENEQYFSFAIDELAGYARKLVLITRWDLLSERRAEPSAPGARRAGAEP